MTRKPSQLLAIAAIFGGALLASADMPFDIAATLQVGSWQEREEIMTDAKGKQASVTVVWMGIVGDETRAGIPYLWLEARTQAYTVTRKGERKPTGDSMIMKSLVEKSFLTDSANPLQNMRKFGKEIIIQAGDAQPMRIIEGGMMANMMMNAFGTTAEFEIKDTGTRETVSVPAGTFDTHKVTGHGTFEMRAMIKTMRVESEMESWLSPEVPFGVVKQRTRSLTNGKASSNEGQLLRYGATGAASLIDDANIQEMPSFTMPKLGFSG